VKERSARARRPTC